MRWSENEWTWETKADLQQSAYARLVDEFHAVVSEADVPVKVLGTGALPGTLFVRWRNGKYAFINDTTLLDQHPELMI